MEAGIRANQPLLRFLDLIFSALTDNVFPLCCAFNRKDFFFNQFLSSIKLINKN